MNIAAHKGQSEGYRSCSRYSRKDLMKTERTDRGSSRPMSPGEKLRPADDHAAGEAGADHASEQDRLTKSGRLKIADLERSEKSRRSRQ